MSCGRCARARWSSAAPSTKRPNRSVSCAAPNINWTAICPTNPKPARSIRLRPDWRTLSSVTAALRGRLYWHFFLSRRFLYDWRTKQIAVRSCPSESSQCHRPFPMEHSRSGPRRQSPQRRGHSQSQQVNCFVCLFFFQIKMREFRAKCVI